MPHGDLSSATTVSRAAQALAEHVLGDLVVLDPPTNRYVRLNATAATLWEALEKPRSLGELAQIVSRRYDIGDERALVDAKAFVERLAERGLVVLDGG